MWSGGHGGHWGGWALLPKERPGTQIPQRWDIAVTLPREDPLEEQLDRETVGVLPPLLHRGRADPLHPRVV